jgi:hypothetical protein
MEAPGRERSAEAAVFAKGTRLDADSATAQASTGPLLGRRFWDDHAQ